jgi:hypothetical protein
MPVVLGGALGRTAPGTERDWLKIRNSDTPRDGAGIVRGVGSSCVPEVTIEQRRALQMLAGAPYGLVVPLLRARGFSATLMIELVSSGYVIARPRKFYESQAVRTFRVTRLVITDAGRRAIDG